MSKIKSKSPYIFVVATAFFLFQTSILLNSFSAIQRMYTNLPTYLEERNNFWTLFWFSSEISGEIGLILRFIGASLFGAFAWVLLQRNEFSLSLLKKAVLFEGVHYLFYIPFILNLFTRPASSAAVLTVYLETAISYTIQTVLITPSLILLYTKIRQSTIESAKLFKWGAIAVITYVFALWVKHFFFNLYALPIDINRPVLLAGFFNSTLTILIAALLLLGGFKEIIISKKTRFSQKTLGIALLLIGTYFVIYILVALINSVYMAFLPLTELWAITMAILGVGFLKENSTSRRN